MFLMNFIFILSQFLIQLLFISRQFLIHLIFILPIQFFYPFHLRLKEVFNQFHLCENVIILVNLCQVFPLTAAKLHKLRPTENAFYRLLACYRKCGQVFRTSLSLTPFVLVIYLCLHSHLLIDRLVFNAVFNIVLVTLHRSMPSLNSFHHPLNNILSNSLAAFPHNQCTALTE